MKQSHNAQSAHGRKTARALAVLVILPAIFFLITGVAWAAKNRPVVHFVDIDAVGVNDGTNWTDAFTDLQDALDAAVSGHEIWVAAGTYKPDLSDRTASFVLKSGVALYGGFMGGETALDQRSSDPGLSILSGDIGVSGNDADNSYHVVYADGVTDAILDGFTVTGGHASGKTNSSDYRNGGGMHTEDSMLTVSNCVFDDNMAIEEGGGMYNRNSTLSVSDCVFSNNVVGTPDSWFKNGKGAGMYNEGQYAGSDQYSVISGCTFSQNVAWARQNFPGIWGGGGMHNLGINPKIDRCTFERNLAWGPKASGGAILNEGARATITNCVFDGNMAEYEGGAVANYATVDISSSTFYGNGKWSLSPNNIKSTQWGGAIYQYWGSSRIVDVIFSDNATRGSGGAIYMEQCPPVAGGLIHIIKSLFHENRKMVYGGSAIDHIQGQYDHCMPELADSLFDVDPLLTDPDSGDFHLLAGSPAIDMGLARQDTCFDNLCRVPLPEFDFDGDPRLIDGDGFAGKAADIGADEYVPTLGDLRTLIVDLAAAGLLDEESAIVLLTYVEDAQTALDGTDVKAARRTLEQMIDRLKAMADTETNELILKMAEAVHGTFD